MQAASHARGDAAPRLAQLEQQLRAALAGASELQQRVAGDGGARCGRACAAQQRLQSARSDLAAAREEHRRDVAQLSGELRRLRSELKARDAQLARARFLHSETLGRLSATVQECGTVSQQLRREMVMLRGNVARGIRAAFLRGRGGAERKALDEAERARRMPVAAELEMRDEQVKLLSLELAVLSHEANAQQIRMEQRLKQESERRLQELSEQRERHKQSQSMSGEASDSHFFKATALGANGSHMAPRRASVSPESARAGSQQHQHQQAQPDVQAAGHTGAHANGLGNGEPCSGVDASDVHHSRASTSDGKHAATVECPQCGSRISEGREGLTDGLECGTDQRVVADINECIRRATGQLETVLSLLYQEDDDGNHAQIRAD